MAIFIKYIVFFILAFNITNINAADITLDLDKSENPRFISADFKSALNIPHPIAFKHLLERDDNNSSGRLFAIAYYFDVKYPNDAIEYDFSDDVAIIFDDLTKEEVQSRTNFIRTLVKSYRWGINKYTELAADFIAPKDPPLIVDDDEYAILGSIDYMNVPEGSFAVIDDFKKVVSYSSNPKDVKAMEAFRLRQLEAKENKTDYEKLQYMVHKIEFSKIPRYGVDLPNPFIGNSGIGKWVEQDGFKARTISELAKINNAKKIIMGMHISTPSHKFMLANNLSNILQKPKIEIIEQDNIESYKISYPQAIQVIHEDMIYGYSDDFMFPIEITTIDPNKSVKLTAQITFQSCDYEINCEEIKINAPLYIEENIDNISSSIKNFIVQSFYNIPQNKNNYIQFKNAYADVSENNTVEKIHMEFTISKPSKNLSILIEDEQNTTFTLPQININQNIVYVTLTPTSNQDKLLNKDFTYTIRLNKYSSLRDTIKLKPYNSENIIKNKLLSLVIFAFYIGLLFYLSPLGLSILCLETYSSLSIKTSLRYWITIICTILLLPIAIYTAQYYLNINIQWGMQYTNVLYLSICTLVTLLIYLSIKYQHRYLNHKHILRAILIGITIIALLPVSNTNNLISLFELLSADNIKQNYLLITSMSCGLVLPYIIFAYLQYKEHNISLSNNQKKWLLTIGQTFSFISLAYLIGVIFMQISFNSAIKCLLVLFICYILYKYFYNFIDALYQTDLSNTKKHITEYIILIIIAFITITSATKVEDFANKKTYQTPIIPTQDNLNDMLANGQMVIIGITSDWSYISNINKLITLNSYTLKRLQNAYNLEYININTATITPKIQQFISEYKVQDLPIYVLYTVNMNKGFVLPRFLKDSELEHIIQNFQI